MLAASSARSAAPARAAAASASRVRASTSAVSSSMRPALLEAWLADSVALFCAADSAWGRGGGVWQGTQVRAGQRNPAAP
jgi:hypothetical protein